MTRLRLNPTCRHDERMNTFHEWKSSKTCVTLTLIVLGRRLFVEEYLIFNKALEMNYTAQALGLVTDQCRAVYYMN